MCKIFLSYSRKDYDIVRRIKQKIEQTTRAKCWMDLEGISYESPDFTKIIAPTIEQASIFVFILTPNSQESRYARNELLLAKTRNKHIFIIEPRECEMTSEFILEYGHYNRNLYYVDYQRQKLFEELFGLLNPNGYYKSEFKLVEDRDLVRFKENDKYGFKDKHTGEVIVPCQWMDVSIEFSCGLAWVLGFKGKFGFINKNGTMIIPCVWKWAFPFSEGMAHVQDNLYKWGYVDINGNLVIPCKWDFVTEFRNGLAHVTDDKGKWFYIDKMGNIVKYG